MVVCDAVLRKLPGALGHEDSAVEESFSAALAGAPEYPHYTRPAEYRGWQVPEVCFRAITSGCATGAAQPRRRRRRIGAPTPAAPTPAPAATALLGALEAAHRRSATIAAALAVRRRAFLAP